MDDLKKYALEDEYDDLIEESANHLDDNICIEGGADLTEEPYKEEEQTDWEDNQICTDFRYGSTAPVSKPPDGTVCKTYQNVLSDGQTTYRSDGAVYKTYDNVFSEGKTTYGSNGVTYKTVKKIFGSGTVTYGSDGSRTESVD